VPVTREVVLAHQQTGDYNRAGPGFVDEGPGCRMARKRMDFSQTSVDVVHHGWRSGTVAHMYGKINIDAAEDFAARFGIAEQGEARNVREAVGAKNIGMTHYRWRPGKRTGLGHTHSASEEMYVVLAGSGRMKVDDEIVELDLRDVLYVAPGALREWEAGPDGLELLAFGEHNEGDEDMRPGWWS